MIRVLLADSHKLLHLGIHTALSTRNEIILVNAVTCNDQLRQLCCQYQPDIILLALNLGSLPCIDVVKDIKQKV